MKSIVKVIAAAAAGIFLTLDMSAGNGVEIGYLHSSYRTNLNSDEMKTASPMSGFQVGLMKDMNIVAGLSLQSGLTYSYLNSAEKEEVPMFNITGSYTEHMLNIPIQVKYTFDIIPAFGVYVFAGPTLSLGLAATTKLSVSGSIAGNTLEGNLKYNAYTNKLKSDNIPDEYVNLVNQYLPQDRLMNRFDVLMGGGVGVNIIKFVTVKGGFDYGLLNRLKGDLANAGKLNRMQYYISVGLTF